MSRLKAFFDTVRLSWRGGGAPEWRLTDAERLRLVDRLTALPKLPTFTVALPLAGRRGDAERTQRSIRAQGYPAWELLCYARPGAAALNRVLRRARGHYFLPLDPGDELAEDALLMLAEAAGRHPDADVVYADEAVGRPGRPDWAPHYKPAWSPEYFLAEPYIGRPAAYRTAACRQAGGFRPEHDAAREVDLVLRLAAGGQVAHVPHVLCRRDALRPTDHEAVARAVGEHLAGSGRGRGYLDRGARPFRVRYPVAGRPAVSIIIPTAGRAGLILRCLDSILERSTYPAYEIILVDNANLPAEIEAAVAARGGVRRVTAGWPFHFAANLNVAARRAWGEYLLFLNDDTEVITPDWLEGLLEFAGRPGVGAVGATLLFPDGRLQHAGVAVDHGSPGHPWYGADPAAAPATPRNCLAVTGACLLTPRDLFLKTGGFDERFPLNYNDVDYCLRLHELGWRSVWTPYVQLRHHEAMGRAGQSTVRPEELALFRQRWHHRHGPDPYFRVIEPTRVLAARVAV